MRSLRVAIVCVLAAVACAAATSSASAATIRVTSGTSYVESGTMTFDPGGLNIVCSVEFNLTLSSTRIWSATLPASPPGFGSRSVVVARPCSGGAALTFLSAPWNVGATILAGPQTQLTVNPFSFQLGIGGIQCLYQDASIWPLNAAGTLETTNRLAFALYRGSVIFCPSPIQTQASLNVNPALTMSLTP